MANRQPWFSQAREPLAVAARLWPGWLAAAVAISVFLTLRHHAATQRAASQRLLEERMNEHKRKEKEWERKFYNILRRQNKIFCDWLD